MGNEFGGYSLSDIAAATGGGRNNGGGFGDGGGAAWLIILFLIFALGGFGRGGFGGGSGGGGNGGGVTYIPYGVGGMGGGFSNEYAWLSNGQKEIMQNTNNGFNTLYLSNQLNDINNGVQSLSSQLCNCCADMNQTVSNGFYNAEISANNRQMANMQQAFATQTAITGAISGLSSDLASCCCENRLATCQTQNIVQNEGNATRFADANNTRDIITNATANTQAILDKLCQLELDGVKAQVDAKNDRIVELQRQLTAADLRASQTAQTAQIQSGFVQANTDLYNLLTNCPIPSTPVYGRTPIFSCPNNNNNGCGCGCGGNNNLF